MVNYALKTLFWVVVAIIYAGCIVAAVGVVALAYNFWRLLA